jgi:hypothetical protein
MSRKRKMAIVPSLVLTASFAAVIPAAATCGGNYPVIGDKDAKPDTIWYGVAAVAYCCFEAGVADVGFGFDADAEASEAGEAGDARDGG